MNRCDDCGRFARWEDLEYDEVVSMDLYGHISESYCQWHKKGKGCHALHS